MPGLANPKDARSLRVLRHPLHPMLSDFPMAFLLASVPLDVIAIVRGTAVWWSVSFWTVVVGAIAAVPTACVGLIDYARIPGGPAAKAATIHMLVNLTAVLCFGIDLLVRGGASPPQGRVLVAAVALDVIGTSFLIVGGWYGGELAYVHGVGVDLNVAAAERPPASLDGRAQGEASRGGDGPAVHPPGSPPRPLEPRR